MDQTIDVSQTRPVWYLTPLPLSRVNTSAIRPRLPVRGHVPSLHSLCLNTISVNFDLFEPSSFDGMSPLLLKRIFSRVRSDREYEDHQEETAVSLNPDEATIWAYNALLQGRDAGSFNLGLPLKSTLAHLRPNKHAPEAQHPLNLLPSLFQNPKSIVNTSLLTSLTLDAMDDLIDDQSVQALRYCTQLTALWMKGCKVTDSGLRLLASALSLPGNRDPKDGMGMWRLRALYLAGCYGVSDRSAKVFAKWPGLVTLDIRDTSCTEVSMDVLNRANQTLFAGQIPDFQPCTDGLVPLFASNLPAADTISNLCLTLIKLPKERPDLVTLNVTSSSKPIHPHFLPFITRSAFSNNQPSHHSVYLDGEDRVFGQDLTAIHTRSVAPEPRNPASSFDFEARERNKAPESKDKKAATPAPEWAEKRQVQCDGNQGWEEGVDRAERFYGYTLPAANAAKAAGIGEQRKADARARGEGDRRLMMVRMVPETWDQLAYAKVAMPMQAAIGGKTQVAHKRRGLEDILSATQHAAKGSQSEDHSTETKTIVERDSSPVYAGSSSPSASQPPSESDSGGIVRHKQPHRVLDAGGRTISDVPSSDPSEQYVYKAPPTNKILSTMYRKKKSARPAPPPPSKPSPFAPHWRHVASLLGSSSKSSIKKTSSHSSPSLESKTVPSDPGSSPTPFTPLPPKPHLNPFAPKRPTVLASSSPTSAADAGGLRFDSEPGKKRTFGGVQGGDTKRRGMKMFSGKPTEMLLKRGGT
ncbi:hypothetical protein I350_05402 [Cryptococcus amylolentus CBS 6273]|uniref:Uncharacterized protein n=1 Tax=Cryptococcus amylolentus CBS 6273 TaxID=1296118 RepID=A0A1E3JY19_9TREE|nr:hypothetical protein I350_05402 [Cryptococcus amylolentus CBS 6273]